MSFREAMDTFREAAYGLGLGGELAEEPGDDLDKLRSRAVPPPIQ